MKILLDEQVVVTVVQLSVSHKLAVDITLDRTGLYYLDVVALAYRQIDKVQGVSYRHLRVHNQLWTDVFQIEINVLCAGSEQDGDGCYEYYWSSHLFRNYKCN